MGSYNLADYQNSTTYDAKAATTFQNYADAVLMMQATGASIGMCSVAVGWWSGLAAQQKRGAILAILGAISKGAKNEQLPSLPIQSPAAVQKMLERIRKESQIPASIPGRLPGPTGSR